MNKAVWIAGIVLLIAAISGVYVYSTKQTAQAPTTESAESGNAVTGANGSSTIVTYTDSGFSPTPQTVAPGTTVTWVNQSSRTLWVEGKSAAKECSAENPATTLFNECQAVSNGGTYSFTFTEIGTFEYSNHENSGDTATIIVTNASSSGPINPSAIAQ